MSTDKQRRNEGKKLYSQARICDKLKKRSLDGKHNISRVHGSNRGSALWQSGMEKKLMSTCPVSHIG